MEGARLEIRPPHDAEMPAIRMLLPDSNRGTAGRRLIAVHCDGARRIAGAAEFSLAPDAVHSVRIRVVRTERRKGIGTRFLQTIEGIGRESGAREALIRGNALTEPDAEPFLVSAGFSRKQRLTIAEAPVEPLRSSMEALHKRLARRVPSTACIVEPGPERRDQISAMFERHIVHDAETAANLRSMLTSGRLNGSVALDIGGRMAGMLIAALEGELACVYARAVEPEYQGSWANALLIAAAIERGWQAGARRVRLDWLEGNRDTEKLARRIGASITGIVDVYRKRIA